MKLGIMQPYLFPYIGYWQLLNAVDRYIIADDVNFIKAGWINRNNILLKGKPYKVIIPIKDASSNRLICDTEILDDQYWRNKLLKTISSSYKKAPFYNDVFPIIDDIINQKEVKISRYLEYSIRRICEYLLIDTQIVMATSVDDGKVLPCAEKVIDICKMQGADQYYNAIGGQELYSYEEFCKSGIEISFVKTNPIVYKQFKNVFVPDLSIIDVMMFNSVQEMHELLSGFELVLNRMQI